MHTNNIRPAFLPLPTIPEDASAHDPADVQQQQQQQLDALWRAAGIIPAEAGGLGTQRIPAEAGNSRGTQRQAGPGVWGWVRDQVAQIWARAWARAWGWARARARAPAPAPAPAPTPARTPSSQARLNIPYGEAALCDGPDFIRSSSPDLSSGISHEPSAWRGLDARQP